MVKPPRALKQRPKRRLRALVTVDLEDWYHANYAGVDSYELSRRGSYAVQHTEPLLAALERRGVRATFFVLGKLAADHPTLIKEVWDAGHEIASHGYAHDLVYRQSPSEFRDDIRRSKDLLETIVGKNVVGYRAPSWSIARDSWDLRGNQSFALRVLAEEGMAYDSSLCPFRTFLYGVEGAPRFPHRVQLSSGHRLWEIPLSTTTIMGRRLGFGGGFYFRATPLWLTTLFAARYGEQGHPFVFYIHPRELHPDSPRVPLAWKERLIHYYGTRGCLKKIERLLSRVEPSTVGEYVSEIDQVGWREERKK